jgi:hypothetical protein
MKTYSNKIALIKNQRGIYCLDTSIGCSSGMKKTEGGCYNDCYAAKSAKIYGYDFSKTILRSFIDRKHEIKIINQINKSKLDFIRIGCSGDPSENWDHCFKILNVISKSIKEIVIITKHWTNLTDEQLLYLKSINVCINTSVSALDDKYLLENSLNQYNRLKPFCKSILRIVSCDFNLENNTGHELFKIQKKLFLNKNTIDTIFRPSKKNQLITKNIINSKIGVFNGSKQLMSKYNKKTYAGKCSSCKEMCGITIKDSNHAFPIKRIKQTKLF